MQTLGKQLVTLIAQIGEHLGFESSCEVEAADSAWVDVVWFDKRLSPKTLGFERSSLRRAPVLPLVGFEVEISTGNNPKHIKGSVSNLNNLSALLGVLVVGNPSIDNLRLRTKMLRDETFEKVEKTLMDRVYRWIYAESQPTTRVVVMTEREISAWAQRIGLTIPTPPTEQMPA